jgi:hypothetical protein
MISHNAFHRYLRIGPAVAALLVAAPALAAPDVIYVSGKGDDANACDTINLPCLTLQASHNKVASGGTVVIIDGGDYKPVVIKKSISIVNESAGVADIEQPAAGGDAITIAAGKEDVVHLRGLSLDGVGVAASGVRLKSAASLHIADCVARRFATAAYLIAPLTKASVVLDNATGADSAAGVDISPLDGAVRGVIENSRFSGNKSFGVRVHRGSVVSLVGGFSTKNDVGVVASGGGVVSARNATSSNNRSIGFSATDKGSILRLAHSVASGNATGASAAAGGQVESYRDNNLRGNGVATAGVFLAVATQ